MKFGLFYEFQLPRPWAADSERKVIVEALEQVELADRLGIDYVWEVEHHFLEEYSHSSAPEVFLAACSQRTSRIRLGHGIVQLPPAVNHPARVAERIATLDLVSGGRVDFGTGEGTGHVEPYGFGIDYETKHAQWAEALDAITRMFVEEPFAGYDGRFFQMPARNVVPKPMQKPHPPIWTACPRPETIATAATNGLGALCFSMFIEPEEARDWVDTYYSLICSDDCIPAGFAVNPQLAVVQALMCHPDEGTAIERGLDGSHFIGYTLQHYYRYGATHRHGESRLWDEFLEYRDDEGLDRELGARPMPQLAARPREGDRKSMRGGIGTPAQLREYFRRYEAAGVDQLLLYSQVGRNDHDHICESLELFAREVMPEFVERDERASKERAERVAPFVEKALARKRELPRREPASR
jgi:alkanesulfonate monooxygenase SsuD/methylene tetrahydromethanopterin reductase-like flavin-dependent oxidoreductase (luciferase family)